MTSPGVSQRFIAGFAAALAEARDRAGHEHWDEPGIAAALRQAAENTPPLELLIAFARAAGDPANTTPAAVLHLNNHAWDSDWFLPCKLHPLTRSRRTDGQCSACWTDRHAVTEPVPLDRHGVPPSAELREQMRADMARRAPDFESATQADADAAVRAERGEGS